MNATLDYLNLENRVVEIACDIRGYGFAVDNFRCAGALKNLEADLRSIDEQLNKMAHRQFGSKINWNSSKQMLAVLSSHGLFPKSSDDPLKDSVSEKALNALDKDNELVKLVLRRSKLNKQITPLKTIGNYVVNGRVYPGLTVSAQPGERFGSSKPTFLNNKKDVAADEASIRRAIVPDRDFVFMSADIASSHPRILAHLSGDETSKNIFLEEHDYHIASASRIFAKPYEEISEAERKTAKTVIFTILYGGGGATLARRLKIPVNQALSLRDAFLNQHFPQIGRYIAATNAHAGSRGYVNTGLFQTRISVPKDKSYVGLNYQIQATESELLKVCLVEIFDLLGSYRSRIALPIHDEVLLQLHKDEFGLVSAIKKIVEKPRLSVPMKSEIKIGRECWAVMEKFECS